MITETSKKPVSIKLQIAKTIGNIKNLESQLEKVKGKKQMERSIRAQLTTSVTTLTALQKRV